MNRNNIIKRNALKKLIQYKKEELEELENFIKPKKFIDKIKMFYRHGTVTNIMLLDIKIRHATKQGDMMKSYIKKLEGDK